MAEKVEKSVKDEKKATVKTEKSKEVKKQTKKTNKSKKEAKSMPKEGYLKQVRKEMKQVKWPAFKEVMKYTASTIVLCLILCAFFLLLNLGLSFVKGLFV